MAHVFTPAYHKINSFLTNGFLAGEALRQLMEKEGGEKTISTSYDDHLRGQIALNCLSKIEGIRVSLLHPAKGGFVVMAEEKEGGQGIFDVALEKNKATIQSKANEFMRIIPSQALTAARQFAIATDESFKTSLSEKTHKTALFILNLERQPEENNALDGCKETVRGSISSDKIRLIILPKKYANEMSHLPADKFKFVDSIDSGEFTFCYKDAKGDTQQIKIKTGISIPDYMSALKELAEGVNLASQPLYTHMTRLPG